MNRSGIGVGSASIVLVFAVLCLTIFALISFAASNIDKAMSDVSVRTVQEYYEADTLAECILAEILNSDFIPNSVRGVDIMTHLDAGINYIKYFYPVSETKNLLVEIALSEDSYDVLSWQVQDISEWEVDGNLPVWTGD